MRYLLLLWLLLPTLGWSQKSKFELGLQLDNDSFVSTFNDFYYTSGLFLFANYKSNKSTSEKKIVHGFKIGQQIYNPRDVKSVFPEDHNRPYAGYLFAEYSKTKMYSSNRIIGTSFKLGVVGPDSKAVDFQNWMHDSFGFGEIMGWEQQIQNLIAIQFEFRYSKPIFNRITSDKIDFHLLAATEIGTVFSSVHIGTLSRISLSKPLTAMQNSNYYNGLGSAVKEVYFFVSPTVNVQAYDATIQGSMFTNDSPVTFNLKPIRFNGEAGLKFKYYQYNLSCMFNYTTDEIKNSSATGYFYGSIVGSYVF
jgi:hypothetical protein